MNQKFNLILLTGLYPKTNLKTITENSKHGIENAADTLQWNLVNGFRGILEENCFEVINFPYIGNYPRHYKKIWYKPSINDTSIIKDNKFCNIIFYKQIDIYNRVFKCISESIKHNDARCVILIYSINDAFIRAAIKAKKTFKNISICLIVPDLLEGMIEHLDWIHSLLLRKNVRILKKQLPFIDKYVFLSEHMKDYFNVSQGDYIVMEGIFDANKISLDVHKEKTIYRDIVYTGNLAERYGILNLAKAFTKLLDHDLRLVVCGIGGAFEKLQEMSKNDNRIILRGLLSHDEIIQIQRNAFLLVNPRTAEGEYTKYSFPSKTMEYFASGTPTLLYKLDGIPEEYYNYCLTIDKWYGVDQLYYVLNDIIKKPKAELDNLGEAARQFVIKNKNPFIQCSKIINFLNESL